MAIKKKKKAKKKVKKKFYKRPRYSLPQNLGSYADVSYDNHETCGVLFKSDHCDPYHRCSVVSNVEFKSVDYLGLYYAIAKHSEFKDIKDYCLDRGIRRIINLNDFHGHGVQGYYGQEFQTEMSSKAQQELQKFIDFLLTTPDTKAIERVLTLEYGHVLNHIKGKKWKMVDEVPVDNISVGDHYKQVDPATVEAYENVDNNACLCIDLAPTKIKVSSSPEYIARHTGEKPRYKLIDGYHRFAAVNKTSQGIMKVVCC